MDQKYTNTTSEIIDINKIKSTDLRDIRISEDFKERYGLGNFETNIIRESVLVNTGMTEYQSKHFVAGSQITIWRQVRQALMELEVRYHAYFEITNSLRKAEVLRKKFFRDLEIEQDDLTRELIQIDLEKNDYDITIWRRKLRQAEIEINSFLSIIKEHVKNEEDLKFFIEPNEDEERKYWVYRMAKQAALDVIAYGRIGSGNMDSIAMMDYEDQKIVLEQAIKYSGMINANIGQITEGVNEQIQGLLNSGKIEIPNIEKSQLDVQHSIEPKVVGERV